jgi:hypothetical protein
MGACVGAGFSALHTQLSHSLILSLAHCHLWLDVVHSKDPLFVQPRKESSTFILPKIGTHLQDCCGGSDLGLSLL